MTRFFLFAGEGSGDLHASRLVTSLLHLNAASSFEGVAGPLMREAGVRPLFKMEAFQVMGLSDVLKALPRLTLLFYEIRKKILNSSPDCVILVDYPGFNLRLARSLRAKGFKGKIVQYISPTVWAHGKERIQTVSKNIDLLLTILPFEAAYFINSTKLNVRYVGHPLVERIASHTYRADWHQPFGLTSTDNLLALFPGSRQSEVRLHLPQQLKAARELMKSDPSLKIAVSCSQEGFKKLIEKCAKKEAFEWGKTLFLIPSDYRYELMRDCKAAFAKSGTISLELALFRVPSVIHYVLTPLNHLYAKCILKLKLPYYCLVNIIDRSAIFPEFIALQSSPALLAESMKALLFDQGERGRIIAGCQRVKEALGEGKASEKAAYAIQELLYDPKS